MRKAFPFFIVTSLIVVGGESGFEVSNDFYMQRAQTRLGSFKGESSPGAIM